MKNEFEIEHSAVTVTAVRTLITFMTVMTPIAVMAVMTLYGIHGDDMKENVAYYRPEVAASSFELW